MITGALCSLMAISCAGWSGLSLGPLQSSQGMNSMEHPYLVTFGDPPEQTGYRYVDDTDPTQAADVRLMEQLGFRVIAGIPQGDVSERFVGAINAQEWYPIFGGIEQSSPPIASAYILQQGFTWPGQATPTRQQMVTLYRQALSHHPKYLFVDNG